MTTAHPELSAKGILVVDDDTQTRKLFESILGDAGYTKVRTATDGLTCLSVLEAEGHDIYAILLDMKMPGLDGFQVVRHLVNVHPHIVGIVMVTGYGNIRTAVEFTQLGSENILTVDFVTKPVQVEEILRDVERTLKLVHAKRADRGLIHLSEVADRLSSIDEKVEKLSARTPGFLAQLGFEVVKTVLLAALVLAILYFGMSEWLASVIHRAR
jgi:two-component system response regulator (stage 0 sporulation protein F)